jgi:hypothetical protein
MAINAFAGIGGPPKQPVKTVKSPSVPIIPTKTGSSYYDMVGAQSATAAGHTPQAPSSSSSGSSGSSNINLQVEPNKALDAMIGNYNQHVNDTKGQDGRMMDLAAGRIRDAREGNRRSLQQDSLFAGRASDPSIASYDAETSGLESAAIADVATQRESNLTNALGAGVGYAAMPAQFANTDKALQIQAATASNAMANNTFNQFLALLNASKQSPIYMG